MYAFFQNNVLKDRGIALTLKRPMAMDTSGFHA
jgi:hypothetical protein